MMIFKLCSLVTMFTCNKKNDNACTCMRGQPYEHVLARACQWWGKKRTKTVRRPLCYGVPFDAERTHLLCVLLVFGVFGVLRVC